MVMVMLFLLVRYPTHFKHINRDKQFSPEESTFHGTVSDQLLHNYRSSHTMCVILFDFFFYMGENL